MATHFRDYVVHAHPREVNLDAPLTDAGVAQARSLRDALIAAPRPIDVVLVSPLSRCVNAGRLPPPPPPPRTHTPPLVRLLLACCPDPDCGVAPRATGYLRTLGTLAEILPYARLPRAEWPESVPALGGGAPVPIVAEELLRERIGGANICDKRRTVSEYKAEFPGVDFSGEWSALRALCARVCPRGCCLCMLSDT